MVYGLLLFAGSLLDKIWKKLFTTDTNAGIDSAEII